MASEFLENYRMVEPTIRKLYDSSLRLAILDALKDGPMRLADLRRAVDANAPNTSSKAKELEGMGIIKRKGGDYLLTRWGDATLQNIRRSLKFFTIHEKFREYWSSRRTDFIPNELMSSIGFLSDSQIVKSKQLDTTYTHDNFVKQLQSVKESFRGISPIYHSEYLDSIKLMMTRGINIELIFTPNVFQQIQKSLTKEEVTTLASYPKIRIYTTTGFDSGISVSESFIVLCLVSKDDVVSLMDQYLYSKGPNAVKWGNKLFDYYKNQATKINLSDYL